jgi:CRP-like cAMP-binding protein
MPRSFLDRDAAVPNALLNQVELSDLFGSLDHPRHTIVYPAGRVIVTQGDSCRTVLRIEDGLVKLLHSRAAGDGVVVALRSAGWVIGSAAAVLSRPHHTTVTALTECMVSVVSAPAFVAHVSSDRAALLALLRAHSLEWYDYVDRLALLTCVSARRRLELLLVELVDRLGTPAQNGGVRLRLPVIQQELATAIHVTPETVCRLFADLEREGVIRRLGGSVTVLQLERLRRDLA